MNEKAVMVKGKGFHPKEVKLLCERLGIDIIDEFKPSSDENKRYFLGKGRLEDIKNKLRDSEANEVIIAKKIDSDVKRRMEKEVGGTVLDRGDIVIRIFDEEGETSLLKHQTKKAKLERDMPKIRRRDSDQKDLLKPAHKSLKKLDKKIEEEEKKKDDEISRFIGRGYPSIALLGYTNAGKSTLFNSLMKKKGVTTEDQLFTTLKHSSKPIEISGYPLFVMDTLGLFKEIPHELLPSFHSTLYGAKKVDFPLLMLDASESEESIIDKLETSLETLGRQGIDEPVVVLNKIDKDIEGDRLREVIEIVEKKIGKEPYAVSAKKGTNVERMMLDLLDRLGLREKSFKIHYRENPDYVINKISKLPLKMEIDKGERNVTITIEGKEGPVERVEGIVNEIREEG